MRRASHPPPCYRDSRLWKSSSYSEWDGLHDHLHHMRESRRYSASKSDGLGVSVCPSLPSFPLTAISGPQFAMLRHAGPRCSLSCTHASCVRIIQNHCNFVTALWHSRSRRLHLPQSFLSTPSASLLDLARTCSKLRWSRTLCPRGRSLSGIAENHTCISDSLRTRAQVTGDAA